MNTKTLLSKNRNGELIYNKLGDYIKRLFKPDTVFDYAVVCFITMLLCACVDGFSFSSLMALICYDNFFMRIMMICGLLFGFDVIPIYLGILHKRLKLKLTTDRTPLYIALVACVSALILNILLNIMTVDLMTPEAASETSDFISTATQQTAAAQAESESTPPEIIAMVLFRIICPFITTCGSYFISYITYHPLETREKELEEAVCEARDDVRRLDALVDAYDRDPDFDKKLMDDIYSRYEAQKQIYRSRVISYCKLVEQELKEHLADSSSTSALSEDGCRAIIESLNTELEAFLKASGTVEAEEEDTDTTDNITSYIAV